MRNRPQENARNPCILLFKTFVLFYSVLAWSTRRCPGLWYYSYSYSSTRN